MELNEKEMAICKKLAYNDLTFTKLLHEFGPSQKIRMSRPTLDIYLKKLETKGCIEKTDKDPKDRRSYKWHLKNSDKVAVKHAVPFILYQYLLKSYFQIRDINDNSPQKVIELTEQLLGKLILYSIISYDSANFEKAIKTLSYLKEFFNSSAYSGILSDLRSSYDLIDSDEYFKDFVDIKKILNCPEMKDNEQVMQYFDKALESDLNLYREWLMSEYGKEDNIKNLFSDYEKLGFPAYNKFKQLANEIEDEVKYSLEYKELLLTKEKRQNEIDKMLSEIEENIK